MKLDDLKYLPILTENVYFAKQERREIQEIAEVKVVPVSKSREIVSDNYVAYILGLIKPGFYFDDFNGIVKKNENWEEHTLVWCNETMELSNGVRLPLEARSNLCYAGLSEILEYKTFKKFE